MSEAISPTPATPPPRDLSSEMSSIMPWISSYYGQEGQAQTGFDQSQAAQVPGFYNSLTGAQNNAKTALLGSTANNFSQFGPGLQGTAESIVPQFGQGLSAIGAQLGGGGLGGQLTAEAAAAGPSPLRTQLDQSAQSQLALGSSLSPEQQRGAEQASRAAWSARGLASSTPAVASEILSRDQYGQQLQQQRQQFAQGVQGQDVQENTANQNFQQGVLGGQRQFDLGATSTAQNALSPTLGFMSQQPLNPSVAAGFYSPQSLIGSGSGLLGYGQDLYNTDYNAQATADIAQENNAASFRAALIGSVGKMAGAAM